MQVGARLTAAVASIAPGGDAVCRVEGRVVFLDDGVPGDVVRFEVTAVKPRFGRGRVLAWVAPSPDAVAPVCAHAERCGGCRYWRMTYADEVALKVAHVREALTRLGRVPAAPELAVVSDPTIDGYRWRARLRRDAQGALGFLERRSHDVVEASQCRVLHPGVVAALPMLRALTERVEGLDAVLVEWDDVREGVVATVELSGVDRPDVFRALRDRLGRLGPLHALVGVCVRVNGRLRALLGDATVARRAGGPGTAETIHEPAGGFSQAHGRLNDRLRAAVVGSLGAPRAGGLLELYAGCGNFTLPASAAGWAVDAVEGASEQVAAAAAALRGRPERATTRFFHADLAEGLPVEIRGHADRYAAWLVDPPRSGLAPAILEAIAASGAERVVYVSCDPPSLGRDVRALAGRGWSLARATVVDMFPRTPHVEVVAVLARAREAGPDA